jgi:ABC-type dipeptide/oligopeptide/nickel transport system permease component
MGSFRRSEMLRSISTWLRRFSSGWIALLGLVVFLAFTALVLPGQSAQAREASGGAGTPDLSFVYSPADLYRMAEAYGSQGRADYIRARFSFDLVWPLVYTFFLATSISWSMSKAFPASSRWQLVNLVPLLGLLLDYLENLASSLVVARYPATTPVVDLLAPVFTLTKWLTLGAGFVLLVIGLVAAGWKWGLRRRAA